MTWSANWYFPDLFVLHCAEECGLLGVEHPRHEQEPIVFPGLQLLSCVCYMAAMFAE